MGFGQRQAFLARSGDKHRIPVFDQLPLHQRTDRWIIIDDEHFLTRWFTAGDHPRYQRFSAGVFGMHMPGIVQRETCGEYRAFALFALHADIPTHQLRKLL